MHDLSTLDQRTRSDHEVQPVDAASFLEAALPLAFEKSPELVQPLLRVRTPPPLTLHVAAAEWTLAICLDAISVTRQRRRDAHHLYLAPQDFADLVNDQVAPNGWFTRGTLRSTASLGTLLDWWLVFRALIDGTPIYEPGAISLSARGGAPLDLSQSFTLESDPDDMHHFLREAGFLRIRDVFQADELTLLSREMDLRRGEYHADDGRSFWDRDTGGGEHLVRMQHFDSVSDAGARLADDERVARIAALARCGHEVNAEAGLIEALFKRPRGGAISDFPWHKDCSLGRHSYECCSMTAGIAISNAGRDRGALRVRPGSHRALTWPVLDQPGVDFPIVELSSNPGDVSLHLSCTMHMSTPPETVERRVVYVGFRLPEEHSDAAAACRSRLRLRTTDFLFS